MSQDSSNIYKYFYNGKGVPRVTDIIDKMISEKSIIQWANSLGFKHKSYTIELNKAAVLGTKTHTRISHILMGDNIKEDDIIPVQSFYKWYDIIKQHNLEVLYSEKSMVCQYYGGTFDALIKIDGYTILIDFKTSNRVTYKYFLQLAAYRKMIREALGIEIDGVMILQLDKYIVSFEEYLMMLPQYKEMLDYFETTFDILAQGYIHIQECEARYKQYELNRGD